MTAAAPRVVVVTRASEYHALLARHGTEPQVRFFLEQRGQSLDVVHKRHERWMAALEAVSQAIPSGWRRARVNRSELSRFLFEPADLVVATGQDGLVANLAKYLHGQLVLGINPDAEQFDGVLVPHAPRRAKQLLAAMAAGRAEVEERTMVTARLDDGQSLLGLNEIFVGHRSHQSARYRIQLGNQEERQSSSGLIVATGTGATGWARSINGERAHPLTLPGPTDPALAMFVREPFPSVSTGTSLDGGLLRRGGKLEIVSEMDDGGVVFGDGIEDDRLDFAWGMRLQIGISEQRLRLVRG
ncbi:MAG TPA: NAD+ kinase [Myxococcaceae bacterium]|nr:NAD+ kinase [Myxococcaceae bacterium]